MRRYLAFIIAGVAAAGAVAQDERTWMPQPFTLSPFSRTQTTLVGLKGRPSRVVATGDGNSPLAIYVYDRFGNCVAYSDKPSPLVDDRIASWVPAATGPFDVQVRNVGFMFNRVEANAK